ncbi:MAG: DUF1826 domain-containing protein [Cyclobacteriaceae bacterium]|nr:DUF1826 domain-containing protein [Cyclobacteriaceae bacterium HetDA_MAG_MS6]
MKLLTSIPFVKPKPKIPRQVISTSWLDRWEILKDDVNLFCWKRVFEPSILAYLKDLLGHNPKSIRLSVNQANIPNQIERVSAHWDQYSTVDGQPFWKDISYIVSDFLDFSDSGIGTMHLRIIEDNACTKFHTDGYPLRLFTTYTGKGTEWLPEKAVNRTALGTANEEIVKDQSQIHQMVAGEVGILKGELPKRRKSIKGIVHRSPEISQTSEKRIILRVDL